MKIGYYPHEDRRLFSVTSFLDNLFGIPDTDKEKWIIKEAVLSVTRQAKKEGRIPTQEQAKKIGLEACSLILKKSQITGIELHQYARNTINGLPYDLEEEYQGYGESFFNWFSEQNMKTILDEKKVENLDYGYAGRLDWYGELNGQRVLLDFKTSKGVRWTYFLQLAAYRKCLEDMGYTVDKMYLLHVKPRKRGGIPRAELIEVVCPFELVAFALKLFRFKLALEPYIDWYERTDETAIEAEKKDVAQATSDSLSVPPLDVQGLPLETQDTLPSRVFQELEELALAHSETYPYQAGIPTPSPTAEALELVHAIRTIHSTIPPEIPAGETSGPSGVIPLDSQYAEGVIRFSAGKPRILPEPFELPSESDISEPPELSLQDS